MPPYDELYDRQRSRYPTRPQSRWRSYRAAFPARMYDPMTERYRAPESAPAARPTTGAGRYLPYPRVGWSGGYDDDFGEYRPSGAVSEVRARMGMRDFSERYGRYSGGSPYSYEYSERTIYHRPRFSGLIGFTRPLGEAEYGAEYVRLRGRMRRYGYRRGHGIPTAPRDLGEYRRPRYHSSFRPYTRWGRC